jgi:hypothetical protein
MTGPWLAALQQIVYYGDVRIEPIKERGSDAFK